MHAGNALNSATCVAASHVIGRLLGLSHIKLADMCCGSVGDHGKGRGTARHMVGTVTLMLPQC